MRVIAELEVTQEMFNEMYAQGMEQEAVSLVGMNLEYQDVLDAAIIKMFDIGLNIEDIMELVEESANDIMNTCYE